MSLIEDWLSLSHHKGLNRALLRHIVEHFSELDRLKGINDARWLATGLNTQGVTRIKRSLHIGPDQKRLSADLHWLEKDATHHLIPINSRQYPSLLAQIEDPPLLIYGVSKDLEKSLHAPALAIVGSRNASPYGMELATEFAYQLAQRGINSISGMAYGVDAAAHRGSLLSRYATTAAIFGCGVDQIYPRQHIALAAEIAQHGALVSEYCCGTAPRKAHFPQRNQMISGLSHGTLVIEAGTRSGSLITAKLALEQNRELFALPGNLHNPLTCGCHHLIQQGAKLVTCIDDIVDEIACFNVLQRSNTSPQEKPSIQDSKQRILLAWLKSLPLTVDAVAKKSGLTTEQVCSMLSTLELSGQVTRDRSGRYHAVATGKIHERKRT